MKKIIRLFSFFVAFFLGAIFYTLTVHANALPITPHTFEVMTNTAEQMLDLGFVPQSLSPYSPISTNNWTPWNAGAVALLSFDLNDCTTTELTQFEKKQLFSDYTIVDTSNVEITVDSPIYCVKMDNGYFTGYCYVDDSGNLLSYSNDLGGQLMQIKYGGSIKTSEDWEELYENTATQVYSSNMVYYDGYNSGTLPELSFYAMGGLSGSGGIRVVEMYIPNQYDIGVCVPVTSTNNGQITDWYCNGTPYYFRVVYGAESYGTNVFSVTSGTYTKNGVSYTKKVHIGFASGAPNNTYSNFISGTNLNNNNLGHYNYLYNSTTYNTMLSDDVTSTAFKPIQLPQGSEIINYNYYYDPTEISRLEQEINNLTQLVNSNFNNQQSISENNFPFYYPVNDTQTTPSEIPFPNVQNYPGFNPFPNNVPTSDPNVNPSIENLDQQIDPTGITNNIPIISGLQNKFPFSIPWDIYNLVKGLSVPREIPVLEWEIEIPIINYTWNPTIDLTMYDSTATLFRTLFLITFIIGLAVFSYNHFFGQ